MTNKELVVKLNSLKKISPDQNWLKNNRELLLSQISNSGGENISVWQDFIINFSAAARAVAQPVYALGVFVLMLLSGSLLFSQQLFSSTKPNDSLYIARIISEKVKLNTVFNTAERDKLAVQYASEHAQDIAAILADPAFNTEANRDQITQLNNNFNKEVDTVKNKISRLTVSTPKQPTTEDANVVIAETAKEGKGIQVFEYPTPTIATSVTPAASTTSATSTAPTSTPALENQAPAGANQILEEAQKLFDNKDYSKASDKLKEVDEMIK
jgi:hypothetical protein